MGSKKTIRRYKRAPKIYIPDGPPKLIPCTVEVPRVNLKGNSTVTMFDFNFGLVLPTREYEQQNPRLENASFELVNEIDLDLSGFDSDTDEDLPLFNSTQPINQIDGFESDRATSSEDEITVLESVTINQEEVMETTALIEPGDSVDVKNEAIVSKPEPEYVEPDTDEIAISDGTFLHHTCSRVECPHSQNRIERDVVQESDLAQGPIVEIESVVSMSEPVPVESDSQTGSNIPPLSNASNESNQRERTHLLNRLDLVKLKLTREGVWTWSTKDLEDVQELNLNPWGKVYLNSIKVGLTQTDYPAIKFGYVYNEIFGQLEAQKTGELSLSTEFNEEQEIDQTNIVSGPCLLCKLSPVKQKPNCYGPQNIAWLTESNVKHCALACIGKQSLLHLPAGPTDILNLGLLGNVTYNAGFDDTEIHSVKGTLHWELKERLEKISKASPHLTVIVEFFQTNEQKHEQVPIEDCLLGFFKVLIDLQSSYGGALILVLGPVMPYASEQLDRYKALKEKANQFALFAKTLGRILGVPVVQTLVQTTYNADLGCYMSHRWWLNVPLFNRMGNPSEEFFRRLAVELKLVSDERGKHL
jgi:hypothetical protein